MLNIRKITRTALLISAIAAGSFATGTAHADPLPDLQYSANIYCNGNLTDVVTVFNNTDNPVLAGIRFQSSLQDSVQTTTVPAHGWVDLTFHLTIGERLDKIIMFKDTMSNMVFTGYPDRVITGTGDCYRPAFRLVEVTGYSLACSGDMTLATITIENRGDYPANIAATGNPWFATEAEADAAAAQGIVSSDTASFSLSPGNTAVTDLFFKIVDQFAVNVGDGQTTVFTDGPRAMAAGEGCAAAPTSTTDDTTTTTEDTTPTDDTTEDTTPTQDTVPEQESGAGAPTGTAPTTTVATTVTTVVGAASGSLPVTGRSSLPIGTFGAIMFLIGLGLVRSVRRRSV